ncbi:site-specific DNA-methyltransferase [Natronosalvus halobius]|uniref:site-specific DNA-methyltransferase n=1 Tax=Natronosalvus halobius TaxID=2953746 RepID=UPI00209E3107|nr:DNA methyltransferase [Natronosalvus halobius]USZ73180.1 DNA methyltransferase [Natronosalvus halobius]
MAALEDIADLRGFGPSKIENFKDAGYEDLEDLQGITWEELGDIRGIKSPSKRRLLLSFLEENGLREKPDRTENYERFRALLEELFQFESADLDFGIYRIMNEKRAEIRAFLDEGLPERVENELDEFRSAKEQDARRRLEAAKTQIQEDFPNWVDEHGNVDEGLLPDDAQGIAKERKEAYFDARQAIEQAEVAEQTEAAIYQDLYRFFKRYYDDGDFVAQRRAANQEKYAIPYNGEEVTLHWANREQYFVKTGEEFTDYTFRKDSYTITFKVHDAHVKRNDRKDEGKYFVLRESNSLTQDGRDVTVHFEYRSLTPDDYETYDLSEGSRTKGRDIQKGIEKRILSRASTQLAETLRKDSAVKQSDSTVLQRHLRSYRTKNESDYFIHKDLNGFLQRELEFYLKNEIFSWTQITEERGEIPFHVRARLNAIENIATDIIDLVSEIENFQKRLFEKQKFVVGSEYCITLDHVPEDYYSQILDNDEQIEAWKELYAIDDSEDEGLSRFTTGEAIDETFLRNNPSVMLDTQYFDTAFVFEILKEIEPLNDAVDGIAIQSENFQALNLLEPTFGNQIAVSYIDPPYNTGDDEGFVYKDNFQSSSWLSMMYDRTSLAKQLLTDNGKLFVSISDDEFSNLKKALDTVFGRENFVSDIIWNSTKSVTNPAPISNAHTHTLFFAKDKELFKANKDEFRLPAITDGFENPDDDPRGPWKADPFEVGGERPNQRYEITNPKTGETFTPKDGNSWKNDFETFQQLQEDDRIVFGKTGTGRPKRKRFLDEAKERGTTPTTLWDDLDTTTNATTYLRNMFGERGLFNNPKPVSLVKQFAKLGTQSDDYILDFFAGSGTTAEATIRLNEEEGSERKYIVIDMGEHFKEVLKPRIIKSVYSDEWEDGTPIATDNESVSHVFKYYSLEQYEDTLDNLESDDQQSRIDEFTGRHLKYFLDFELEGSSLLEIDELRTPFEYQMKIRSADELEDTPVDLVETFNHLLGLHVDRIRRYERLDREYRVVHGENEDGDVTVIWRPVYDDDDAEFFERERDFLRDEVVDDEDVLYINRDSALPETRSIEKAFGNRMW